MTPIDPHALSRPKLPVVLNDSLCNNCQKCLNACPTGVFQVNAQTGRVETRFASDCHVCFLCVPDCPTQAITVHWDAPNARHLSIYDVMKIDVPEFDRPDTWGARS